MSEEEDPELVGVPIGRLTEVESDVSSQLLTLIRKKIYRRTAASHFAGFSWSMPMTILLEFINLLIHLFSVVDGKKSKIR